MKKVWQYAIMFSILTIVFSFLYPLCGVLKPSADYAAVYRASKMIWITLAGSAWLVVSVMMAQPTEKKRNASREENKTP